MEIKTAIVTGGSSGIGYHAALELAKAGYAVYEFSRRDFENEDIRHIKVDITDESQVFAAVKRVFDETGRIDVLINNAGFGISGAVEMTASEESHAQLEVNLFGMDNCTRAVIPYMREAGSGRIVCTGSIAGIVSIPFQTWYSVSKAAINAYVLGLQNEVHSFGITVAAVMPGDICTGFTDARKKNMAGDDIYKGKIDRSVKGMEKDERGGMSPETAGRFIARTAMKKNSRPLLAIGAGYKALSMVAKLTPRRFSNWIVRLLYAR